MSIFNFTLPNGQSFEVKAPEGVTFDQAQAIFKQQVDTGGLVGFKVGDAVNVVSQALGGLVSAQSSALQSISSALGKVGVGTDLRTITDSIGTSGIVALKQAQSALTGNNAAIASLTTNLNSAVNGSVGNLNSALSGITGSLNSLSTISSKIPGIDPSFGQGISALSTALTGQAAQIGSLANDTLKTIQTSITGTPLNGINLSDFINQGPSLGAISNLSQENVTATLAQASKLVGQNADQLSNALGLGKFGLDASQLERSGFLKPGTVTAFLDTAKTDLSSLLGSPLPWTGKDGINGVTDLLGSGEMQDKIQQGIMSLGVKDLGQIGIPVDSLTPEALSGLATSAAKSVTDTLDALQTGGLSDAIGGLSGGLSVDSFSGIGSLGDLSAIGSLGGLSDITSSFGSIMSNSSFSVSFVSEKVEPPVKQQEIPPAATDTVNSSTLNAAANRVIGNDKVPDVSNNTDETDASTKVTTFTAFVTDTYSDAQTINANISGLEQAGTISQESWNMVNQELISAKNDFNARIGEIQTAAAGAISSVTGLPDTANAAAEFRQSQAFVNNILLPLLNQLKIRLDILSSKIVV
jgi:hypothetical protein